MTDGVRLELPFPPPQLSPNARVHHMKKARIVREYREDCAWAAMALRRNGKQPSVAPPVRAVVTFVVPDRRRRDEQNCLQMLKPAFDGLVDAGVLVDDNHEVFSVERTSFEVGEPKVIVVLKGAGSL